MEFDINNFDYSCEPLPEHNIFLEILKKRNSSISSCSYAICFVLFILNFALLLILDKANSFSGTVLLSEGISWLPPILAVLYLCNFNKHCTKYMNICGFSILILLGILCAGSLIFLAYTGILKWKAQWSFLLYLTVAIARSIIAFSLIFQIKKFLNSNIGILKMRNHVMKIKIKERPKLDQDKEIIKPKIVKNMEEIILEYTIEESEEILKKTIIDNDTTDIN